MNATASLQPVARPERVELLDILRGVAVLGILLVNFWGNPGQLVPRVDQVVSQAVDWLFKGSFYPLFSFLFGLGFAIQLERARARGAGVAVVYLRRLLVLMLIGAAHGVLIWQGDILFTYALLGLWLIPLYRLPSRGLVTAIVLLLAFQLSGASLRDTINKWRGRPPFAVGLRAWELKQAMREEQGRVDAAIESRASGSRPSYRDDLTVRWHQTALKVQLATVGPDEILGRDILLIFLVGLYAGRRRWIQDAAQHRKTLGVMAIVAGAISVGAIVYGTIVPNNPRLLDQFVWGWAQNKGGAVFYICAIAWAVTGGGRAARALKVFAPAGTMALTNYLSQSLVMTWLFLPYGFNLPEPSTTAWVLINLTFFFGVQLPFSRWWLARFRYGPAEWVWRSITYGTFQPMRREGARPSVELMTQVQVAGGTGPAQPLGTVYL